MKYTVAIRGGNESAFVATVPALPGCVSQGVIKAEVLRNIKEAIEGWIETMTVDGQQIPEENLDFRLLSI